MTTHPNKRRRRDWTRARPGVSGPSAETGRFRAVLRGSHGAVWWQCAGHRPHDLREQAWACAAAALRVRAAAP